MKPNLAVFFFAASLLAREWRILAGIAAGCVLVLASLALGVERWHEYAYTTRHFPEAVATLVPTWKQLTLFAFWRTLSAPERPARWAIASWLASAAGLGAVTALAWWRRRAEPAALPRLFGLTVLLALTANVYVYFYEGLLPLVPGVVWWVQRDEYRSRLRHALIGSCLLGIFVDGYLRIFLVWEGISWAGPLIALWLVCEASDLLAAGASAPRGA